MSVKHRNQNSERAPRGIWSTPNPADTPLQRLAKRAMKQIYYNSKKGRWELNSEVPARAPVWYIVLGSEFPRGYEDAQYTRRVLDALIENADIEDAERAVEELTDVYYSDLLLWLTKASKAYEFVNDTLDRLRCELGSFEELLRATQGAYYTAIFYDVVETAEEIDEEEEQGGA